MNNPYQPPKHDPDQHKSVYGNNGWPIGGLLWLLAFEIVTSPIAQTYGLYEVIMTFINQNEGTELPPNTHFEFVAAIIGVFASFYLAQLFLQKHHLFPKRYVVITGLFMLLTWYQIYFIPPIELQQADPELVDGMMLFITLWYLGWALYLTQTERAKNTFVRHRYDNIKPEDIEQ